jgi:anti-anti-sigma factor
LKETINSLISTGKRNFAFDLSTLDYIYSDTINVLMALNKRTLDVSGRLALLSPQPEVLEILKRAGIHNILRIFENETDLIKTSEDIILQTTSIKMADIKSIAEQIQPQSEFDQLRDEIGSVFGASSASGVNEAPAAPQKPKVPQKPSAPAYDQNYQNFGQSTDNGYDIAQPEQPQFVPPPAAPRTPPVYSAPQTPQFQNRQFTPPPPRPAAPRPMQPPVAPPQPRSVEPPPMVPPRSRLPEVPKAPEYSFQHQETQRFNTAPVPTVKSPRQKEPPQEFDLEEDLEEFSSSKKKGIKPVKFGNEKYDDDDFDDIEVKKRSSLPVFLVVALIIIVGGVGAFFVMNKLGNKSEDSEKVVSAPVTTTPQQQAVPQLPVEQPTSTATTQPQATVPEEPVNAVPPVTEPVVEKKVATPVVEKRVLKQKVPSRVREAVPPPQPAKPSGKNMLVINSVPAGATVSINGEQMGTTPFTWKEPVFGMVSIKVSKQGYADNTKSLEFTGGSIKESFKLDKEALPPPQPKAPVVKTELPKPEPESVSSDEFDAPPKPSKVEINPEPEAEPEPEPAPAPKPVVSSAGGDASIFIASIPPVADVYLDGKLIGKTNVTELKMPSGPHTLRFVKGGKEVTKQLTLQPGKNPSQMVKLP